MWRASRATTPAHRRQGTTWENRYFNETIKPLLDGNNVRFVGEVNDRQKQAFLGNAAALLFPIDWPEPFGLVMIEAMACGTPVIAWPRGSVREVIEDGVTGFIVDSEAEAVEAISQISPRPGSYQEKVRAAIHRAAHGRGLRRQLSETNNDRRAGALGSSAVNQSALSAYGPSLRLHPNHSRGTALGLTLG